MKRMSSNFPHGGAMDTHFANMRSLIQVALMVWAELVLLSGSVQDFRTGGRLFDPGSANILSKD